MSRVLSLYDTTIGKKAVVAVTGIVLFGFVIGHMLGNLQVFLGPEVLNDYAAMLKGMPGPLWAARIFLVISVGLHFGYSIQLHRASLRARPVRYRDVRRQRASYASITMRYSGPMLALFIVYHLAHFTFPGLAMGDYAHEPHDVYANFINAFRIPWVTLVYLVAQVLLGLHLYHGAWSLFQTLGLSHPRYNTLRERVPQLVAATVVAGNVSMPLAVLGGLIG